MSDPTCDVQLDNARGEYRPGQVLSGRIVFKCDERILIKSLAIKIAGYAAVSWEKVLKYKKAHKSDSKKDAVYGQGQPEPVAVVKHSELYTNREDYIATTNYFIGSEAAHPKIIERGVYSYTFTSRLPENCPSQFESATGHIRYELEVFVDYPDHRYVCFGRTVDVFREIDLRLDPALLQPINVENIEKKSIVKLWQQPLQLQLNVPQSGYTANEAISVHVKVLNYDLLTLTYITYKLNQITTYTGMHKRKQKQYTVRNNLLKTVHGLFGQNGSVVQHLQVLYVPCTTPSTDFSQCKCIQISYELEVLVTSSNRRRCLSALIPIKIGTIALQNVSGARPRDLNLVVVPSLTAARSGDNLGQSEGFDASAPPSETPTQNISTSMGSLAFKEADYMSTANFNKKEKHTMSGEKSNFKPKYIFYDMEETTSVQTEADSTTRVYPVLEEKPKL